IATSRRCGRLQFENVDDLPALGAFGAFADDGRALARQLMARIPQAGDVQQHVAFLGQFRLVRHDEAIPLAGIEPFDLSDDLYGLDRLHHVTTRHLEPPPATIGSATLTRFFELEHTRCPFYATLSTTKCRAREKTARSCSVKEITMTGEDVIRPAWQSLGESNPSFQVENLTS